MKCVEAVGVIFWLVCIGCYSNADGFKVKWLFV